MKRPSWLRLFRPSKMRLAVERSQKVSRELRDLLRDAKARENGASKLPKEPK